MADKTVEEYRAEQQAEYAQYRALLPITYDGVRAYNAGDPVPASNVELHGYEVGVQVERTDTGTAPAAPVPPTPQPDSQPAPQPALADPTVMPTPTASES